MAPSVDPLSLLKQLEGRVQTGAEFERAHGAERQSGRDEERAAEIARELGGVAQGRPARAARRKKVASLAELIPHAQTIERAGAKCIKITTTTGLGGERSRYGYLCPGEGAQTERVAEAFGVLDRNVDLEAGWGGVDPEKIAFIDTETTSLAGGSGTFVFLIGVGWFRGDEFVVHQFFAEDFCEEPALLEAVDEELAGAEAIATYNGKTFDLPLMETRWRMNRRRPAFPALHMDLLHPARRLWKARLPDCRLDTIERDILGVMRVSDVPGAAIPEIYFDYLRGARPDRVLAVIDHHAQDIYSLGALAGVMCHALREPAHPRFGDAADQAGLARIFLSAKRPGEAVAALERAVLAARDEEMGFRLSMVLARQHRRLGNREEAVAIWEARAEQATIARLDPLIELAKHAEHQAKDFDAARAWTERAIRIAEADSEFASWIGERGGSNGGGALDALRHRLGRVQAKARRGHCQSEAE